MDKIDFNMAKLKKLVSLFLKRRQKTLIEGFFFTKQKHFPPTEFRHCCFLNLWKIIVLSTCTRALSSLKFPESMVFSFVKINHSHQLSFLDFVYNLIDQVKITKILIKMLSSFEVIFNLRMIPAVLGNQKKKKKVYSIV